MGISREGSLDFAESFRRFHSTVRSERLWMKMGRSEFIVGPACLNHHRGTVEDKTNSIISI